MVHKHVYVRGLRTVCVCVCVCACVCATHVLCAHVHLCARKHVYNCVCMLYPGSTTVRVRLCVPHSLVLRSCTHGVQ